jgi:YbgC/YbaW family acyl-CoA thioester hydrolase
MPQYFSRTFRVRWGEVNAIGQVALSDYFRYVVETAWDWGATSGLGIAASEELGLAWVVRESEIDFLRPLYANDVFELRIWLVDWRRVRGTRCFELVLKEGGAVVAQGVQEIVALDGKTLRPVVPPEHAIASLTTEQPRVFAHRKFPKFQIQRAAAFITRRAVEWRDLDSMEHVNNANYATFAEDAATQALAEMGWSPAQFKSQGFAVLHKRVQIRYLSPASWGETLDVTTSLVDLNPAGGVWYVDIKRASDHEPIVDCTLEWSLADRTSREGLVLPESLLNALKDRLAVVADHPG